MANRDDRRHSTSSQQSLDRLNDVHHESFDLYGNEYSVGSFPVVDGYQPSSLSHDAHPSSSSPPRTTSRRSIALQTEPSLTSEPPKKKQALQGNGLSLAPRNSFSLRHDAQYSDPPRRMASIASTSGMTEMSSARPFSTASRLSMHRPPSSFVGASAPSHPYGMYPQDTLLNRQSTASSYRPSHRSISSSQPPTHPYGMYPQSIDNASETDPLQSSSDITSVGFPGLNQQYARRLGSEGEEADDIIGPDGHTEQLPPYTRYPDGSEAGPLPPKQRTAGSRISHISTEVPQTANSRSSMTDAPLLSNRAPVDGVPESFDDPGSPQVRSRRGKLVKRSKKRTCFGHLPIWAVALMIFLLVIVAATVGAVIGRLLPHHSDDPTVTSMPGTNGSESSPAMVTMITTTIHDAAPLQTTASGIMPAPTGQFSILMGATAESSSSCIDGSLVSTWECASGAFLSMNVTNPMWDAAQISLSNDNFWDHGKPSYGAVAPSFNGTVSASLMNDTRDPQFGPALFFYQLFDKVVVLQYPNTALNATPSSKQSTIPTSDKLLKHAPRSNPGDLKEGDQAWVCYWNNTSLEGFIYVEQNASANANDTAVASSIALTDAPQPTPPPPSNRRRDKHHDDDNNNNYNNSSSSSNNNSSSSDDHKDSDNDNDDGDGDGDGDNGDDSGSDDDDDDDNHHSHHHHHFSNEDKGKDSGGNSWPSNVPQLYPKVIKLQERRDTQTKKQAYCQAMQVQSDNSFAPVPGPLQIVNLQENDADINDQRVVFVPNRRRSPADESKEIQKRQSVANFCHCEWLSQ